MNHLLRIVPAIDGVGLQRTRGTKVLTPDGVELAGVVGVDIVGVVNDVWRATIHCHVIPPAGLTVLAKVVAGRPRVSIAGAKPPRWWQRLLIRIAGGVIDCTSLASDAKDYRKA